MAKVVIYRSWSDGDALQILIEVDASYPDALREAKRTALDAYAEAHGITLNAEHDEPTT